MKRIFYNNKLKKLFISLSLVVMMFAYVVPFRAYAAVNTDVDTVAAHWKELTDSSGDIQDIMWTYYDSIVKDYTKDKYKTLISQIKAADSGGRNTVTSEKTGNTIKIYINVISITAIKQYFSLRRRWPHKHGWYVYSILHFIRGTRRGSY